MFYDENYNYNFISKKSVRRVNLTNKKISL